VVAGRRPFDHEPVDELSGEPDADADTRKGGGALVLTDGVVEEPVEVRQRDVDGDARDRQLSGRCR
jgi:hypothetical protein